MVWNWLRYKKEGNGEQSWWLLTFSVSMCREYYNKTINMYMLCCCMQVIMCCVCVCVCCGVVWCGYLTDCLYRLSSSCFKTCRSSACLVTCVGQTIRQQTSQKSIEWVDTKSFALFSFHFLFSTPSYTPPPQKGSLEILYGELSMTSSLSAAYGYLALCVKEYSGLSALLSLAFSLCSHSCNSHSSFHFFVPTSSLPFSFSWTAATAAEATTTATLFWFCFFCFFVFEFSPCYRGVLFLFSLLHM